ncbi:MAG: cytochrome c oxidase accessory protein CcoG [Pontibacterium sp.]
MEKIPLKNMPFTPLSGNGKIHVRLTQGFFQTLRRLISGSLLALFFGIVWIQADGQPGLLFDFNQHRINLFGIQLSWFDLPLLGGLMIAGTLLLFFMALGWGRIWCGFACPQSIWTWLFIRIEQWTEGDASLRRKQERQPLKGSRLIRRLLKHSLWLCLSLATAITFTGYFVPIREIIADSISLTLSLTTVGWIMIMATLTYLNGGLVREKVCLHMCPYSRFQTVMFDADTRTVSYNSVRGEPRRRSNNNVQAQGDCIDCSLCVQVCPTGIDIRHGLQYECINCGACIDACDRVMNKIGQPKGLIAFYSDNQLKGKPSPLLRPRLWLYLAMILITSVPLIYGFGNKTELLVEVRRDRQQLYLQLENGELCNIYHLKVESFTGEAETITISAKTTFKSTLRGQTVISPQALNQWFSYHLCTTGADGNRNTPIRFLIQSETQQKSKASMFIRPLN